MSFELLSLARYVSLRVVEHDISAWPFSNSALLFNPAFDLFLP